MLGSPHKKHLTVCVSIMHDRNLHFCVLLVVSLQGGRVWWVLWRHVSLNPLESVASLLRLHFCVFWILKGVLFESWLYVGLFHCEFHYCQWNKHRVYMACPCHLPFISVFVFNVANFTILMSLFTTQHIQEMLFFFPAVELAPCLWCIT